MDPKAVAYLRSLLEIDDINILRTRLAQFIAIYGGTSGDAAGVEGPGGRKPYQRTAPAAVGGPKATIDTSPMARAIAMARCSPDQRAALQRVFGSRSARPTVGRTANGELVMSHIGVLPQGSTVLSKADARRGRPWAA